MAPVHQQRRRHPEGKRHQEQHPAPHLEDPACQAADLDAVPVHQAGSAAEDVVPAGPGRRRTPPRT